MMIITQYHYINTKQSLYYDTVCVFYIGTVDYIQYSYHSLIVPV